VVFPGPAAAGVRRDSTYLADLTADEREALAASAREQPLPEDPRALLEQIFALRPAYRFDVGLLIADTDRRWFRIGPSGVPGEPVLDLRRWPGDTALAFYVLRGGTMSDEAGPGPPVPRSTFGRPEKASEGTRRWIGTVDGESGSRTVGWEERVVPGTDLRLGALMVPGDAGLGPEAVDELYVEILAVLERAVVVPETWATSASEIAVAGEIVLPPLGLPPEASDESTDSWQITRTRSFTLGLPPGVRSRRASTAVPAPDRVPDGVLWFRGRFTNSDGESVVLGDPHRGGYVAEIAAVDDAWLSGVTPPRGAPRASLRAGASFDLAAERTAAISARAERWSDSALDKGEWLVFRLQVEGGGVEIGLPVFSGRQSEALFWIPLTWRGATEPPAPPPIDPAKRFGIRFERLTPAARKQNPWIEGYLEVPGLRLELPVGWWPIANLRSDDGFPVQLLDRESRLVAGLTRVELREIDLSEGSGWEAVEHVRRYHAAEVFSHANGQRLYVSAGGRAFLLSPDPTTPPASDLWDRVVESALLTRDGT